MAILGAPPEVIAAVVIAVLSLIISGYANYTRNDKDLAERVTTVETQQKNDGGRLDRIEAKIDRLLERTR